MLGFKTTAQHEMRLRWLLAVVQRDVTEEASAAVRLIRAIRQQATLSQVVDILRGANTRAVKDKGHDSLPDHGACKALRCTSH